MIIVKTPLEELVEQVHKKKNHVADLGDVSKKMSVSQETLEDWAQILYKDGYAKINRPILFFKTPTISCNKKYDEPIPHELPEKKRLIEEYRLEAQGVPGKVKIWDIANETMPLYSLDTPKTYTPTSLYLDHLLDLLTETIKISNIELTDIRKLINVQEKFKIESSKLLEKRIPTLKQEVRDVLAGLMVHRVFGLEDMEFLIADDWLEEIGVNSAYAPVGVYHRKYGWCKTDLYLGTEKNVYNYASQIARKVGKQITNLDPLLDAHLITGDRVAASLFPISSPGNTITLRKFARNPWTIIHFIDPSSNTLSQELAATLWLAIEYELNVVLAGGTASGKTSMLNSLCAFMPGRNRLLSIEDTRELKLPKYLEWNWISLATRTPNPEGKGGVTMLDLLLAALRMRPDRVIVGEIRRREEAEVLFEGMHTGHSVYSTMHADRAEQAIDRLTQPPINLPPAEVNALHLIAVMYRERRKGFRRMLELAEVIPSEEEGKLGVNIMYRWMPRDDSFRKMGESSRLFEEITLHTGMTKKEINKDIKRKQNVLDWLLKNKWNNVDQVGEIMRIYYKEPERVYTAAEQKKDPAKL